MTRPTITIYTRDACRYCDLAKSVLDRQGQTYRQVDVLSDAASKAEFLDRTNGAKTVPQITVGDTLVGGFEDLVNLVADGRFQQLIGGN